MDSMKRAGQYPPDMGGTMVRDHNTHYSFLQSIKTANVPYTVV